MHFRSIYENIDLQGIVLGTPKNGIIFSTKSVKIKVYGILCERVI
jgi:hypothetical protein